jgi:hypothetical protein
MTTRKIESESVATSTIAADRPLAHQRMLARRLVILAVAAAGVAWLAGPAGRLLVALPLLLFGPGLLIERALAPFARLPWPARPTLWLGLSLSTIALIYEWATTFGLPLTPLALALLAAACGLALIWRIWADIQPPAANHQTASEDHRRLAIDRRWPAMLLAILALTLSTRFYEIRDLALPNWVDSIHHALMIRVAAERGQAPLSLRPYMPIDQLPYHWGYHVFVAAAMRLSSMELPRAMLWTGQALNALHALAAAGLAAYLWRRPLAGVAAALVVGLLSIFPAYYVSWGRYTQLAGLLLLPALMIAWLELLGASGFRTAAEPAGSAIATAKRRWRPAIVLAILLAGLSLIHFIALAFGLCFIALSAAIWASSAQRGAIWSRLIGAAASAGLALALAGPWLRLLAARALLPSSVGEAPPLLGQGAFYSLDTRLLWAGHNRLLIALALAAALWGLRRRAYAVAAQLAWVAGLCLLANPWLLLYALPAIGMALLAWGAVRRRILLALSGSALALLNPWLVGKLPYLAIINNETIVISLFLPIGVLLGGGAVWLWEWIECRAVKRSARQTASHPFAQFAFQRLLATKIVSVALLAALALWGAWNMRDVVNPTTVLATAADAAAIGWVAEHTPPDARFLINAAPWLGTGRGADGGWWLLPLAGRWTSTPPALYDYGPAEYVRATRARTQQLRDFVPGQEQALYQLIDHDQISYIYLGPSSKPITPAAFPASQGFEKVYEQDGVTIFAVHRP